MSKGKRRRERVRRERKMRYKQEDSSDNLRNKKLASPDLAKCMQTAANLEQQISLKHLSGLSHSEFGKV